MLRGLLPFVLLSTAMPRDAFTQVAMGAATAPDIPWLRLVLSFAFCVALALGAAVLLRKMHGTSNGLGRQLLARSGGAKQQIAIVESRRIGRSAQLCLVEFGDRHLLLAVTDSNIEILAEKGCAFADLANESGS